MSLMPRSPSASLYRLQRDEEGKLWVEVVAKDGPTRRLRYLAIASRSGFEVGTGLGAADLALALAADLVGAYWNKRAYQGDLGRSLEADAFFVRQSLKHRFLARLEVGADEVVELDAEELFEFIRSQRAGFRGSQTPAHG